jgi:hypothetical protein
MIRMVMLRHIVIGRRRLRIVVLHRVLVVLHRVLVVLVLEALRGVLLLQIHRSCWFCDSVFCTYRFCCCFSVFH